MHLNKLYLLLILLLGMLAMLYIMSDLTLKLNKDEKEQLAPETEAQKIHSEQRGPVRLSPDEINILCHRWEQENPTLNQIKYFSLGIGVGILFLLIGGIMKYKLQLRPFDGLAIAFLALILNGHFWLFEWFNHSFDQGSAATHEFRWKSAIVLFIMETILLGLSYKITRKELDLNQHTQKWIAFLTLFLTIITGLKLLIIGIAALLTPDLSGNIT